MSCNNPLKIKYNSNDLDSNRCNDKITSSECIIDLIDSLELKNVQRLNTINNYRFVINDIKNIFSICEKFITSRIVKNNVYDLEINRFSDKCKKWINICDPSTFTSKHIFKQSLINCGFNIENNLIINAQHITCFKDDVGERIYDKELEKFYTFLVNPKIYYSEHGFELLSDSSDVLDEYDILE